MNYTEVINNAINEYEEAKRSGKDVEQAINGMENVYIMVSDKNVKDSDNLRKTILEARTNKLIAYYDWYANAWKEAAQKAKEYGNVEQYSLWLEKQTIYDRFKNDLEKILKI